MIRPMAIFAGMIPARCQLPIVCGVVAISRASWRGVNSCSNSAAAGVAFVITPPNVRIFRAFAMHRKTKMGVYDRLGLLFVTIASRPANQAACRSDKARPVSVDTQAFSYHHIAARACILAFAMRSTLLPQSISKPMQDRLL